MSYECSHVIMKKRCGYVRKNVGYVGKSVDYVAICPYAHGFIAFIFSSSLATIMPSIWKPTKLEEQGKGWTTYKFVLCL